MPVQPAPEVQAIRIFASPVPVVLLLLSILFAWRYPITREQHRSLLDELATREA
ncbi:MAG: hypothetical protein H8D78_13475 [Chloroflexi bacterium]|nr:hypothetical protein [Chloroflexota bacterium]